MSLNFAQYQERAKVFALYKEPSYPFIGLAEEVGEFLGIAAKAARGDDLVKRFGTREAVRQHALKEAGDVLWQLSACLNEHGLSLQDAAELNLKKLEDRAARGVIQGSGDNR